MRYTSERSLVVRTKKREFEPTNLRVAEGELCQKTRRSQTCPDRFEETGVRSVPGGRGKAAVKNTARI